MESVYTGLGTSHMVKLTLYEGAKVPIPTWDSYHLCFPRNVTDQIDQHTVTSFPPWGRELYQDTFSLFTICYALFKQRSFARIGLSGRKQDNFTGWKTNSKLRKSFWLQLWLQRLYQDWTQCALPYFGWKSCWLMAALPAGEWLFRIILEARKRKSSNNGLISDEPGIEQISCSRGRQILIGRFYCAFLSEQHRHVRPPDSNTSGLTWSTFWELSMLHRSVACWDQETR